jgi:DNA-3-methyladenine glycosylase II
MNPGFGSTGFEIDPRGGYSLEESAGFIGAWHKAPSDGGAAEGHLHLGFGADGDWSPVGVCLKQDSAGRVAGTVYGDADAGLIREQVERILSLDVDGAGWPAVAERDPVVAKLQRMFPGFRPVNWSNAYEAAAWCLISSRISMRQGQGIKERMSRELGDEVDIHGHRLWVFPGPVRLSGLTSFKGLFGRKLAGIGEFGSQLIRLRALSAVDELPTREPRLLGAIRTAYGLPTEPDIAKLEHLAEAWRPYRMWVCVCLRRTLESGAGMTHSRAAR